MLRSSCSRPVQQAFRRGVLVQHFSSSSSASSHHPNAPLDLDPSFQVLLKDADMAILKHKAGPSAAAEIRARPPRQLEEYSVPGPTGEFTRTLAEMEHDEGYSDPRETRKSPAAAFGSRQIGSVVVPYELQSTITRLIQDSDKSKVHLDAARLFMDENGEEGEWDTSYDVKYKSRRQASRHAERDGTAFASVALPSHYSAVYAVLHHIKQRLGPEFSIDRVIDWGCGTGTGLWATSHAFQMPGEHSASSSMETAQLSLSNISMYLGIDKREGLVSIGRRLLKDVDKGRMSVSFQKSFQNDDKVSRTAGGEVLALSAFMLSSLPNAVSRKQLAKEMWESGAGTIILIDHNTRAGFESIAEAREALLRMGQKEMEDPEATEWPIRGSHVVAPCPHDGACPLYYPGSTKLICGFSQRLQRPAFVRKTKHSGVGHEDVGYSYVVVRRGPRPAQATTKSGRIGEVGIRALQSAMRPRPPIAELFVEGEEGDFVTLDHGFAEATPVESDEPLDQISEVPPETLSNEELESALRAEAFSWPRLIFPPIKKSGHIIIDACTPEAKIMRLTIPKSQGKQPFYDARKSSWGDLYPHEPKNKPQERYDPNKAKGDQFNTGQDIGKRRGKNIDVADKTSYNKLADDIKEKKRRSRREKLRLKDVSQDALAF